MSEDATWRASIEQEIEARNAGYMGPDTPLSPENRKAFHGLKWFPLDARFRVPRAKLARHVLPKPGNLASTGSEAVAMLEAGVFQFEIMGVPCRLLAFEPAPGEAAEPYLLIPFLDLTTGKETYGAGRYLDVEPRADDEYELDFNRAYHPYCAHDDSWSCTLPPRENRLPVRIEAGERL